MYKALHLLQPAASEMGPLSYKAHQQHQLRLEYHESQTAMQQLEERECAVAVRENQLSLDQDSLQLQQVKLQGKADDMRQERMKIQQQKKSCVKLQSLLLFCINRSGHEGLSTSRRGGRRKQQEMLSKGVYSSTGSTIHLSTLVQERTETARTRCPSGGEGFRGATCMGGLAKHTDMDYQHVSKEPFVKKEGRQGFGARAGNTGVHGTAMQQQQQGWTPRERVTGARAEGGRGLGLHVVPWSVALSVVTIEPGAKLTAAEVCELCEESQ